MEMLGHITNTVGGFTRWLIKNFNAATIRPQQTKYQFEQCSLAPPVRPQQSDEIPSANSKVHFLKNRDGVERKPEISNLYNGISHLTPHLRADLNLEATWRRLVSQSAARGSTKTICPSIDFAIVWAACHEN